MIKNAIKTSILLLLLAFVACSDDGLSTNETTTQNKNRKADFTQAEPTATRTSCNIYSTTNVLNTPGNQETFSVSTDLQNASFSWTSLSSNITIIGSTTGSSITVVYGPNFNGGSLRVDITSNYPSANMQCDTTVYLPYEDPCNKYTGAFIHENIPACYPASHPYGRYVLQNYSGNNSDVTWSVNYGTVLLQSGAAQVHVKAASLHPFTLTATINDGQCTRKVSKVIYPCDASGGFGK